jgi:hypothetical protein
VLVIGFGYKARRGKNSACEAIMKARGKQLNIRQYAFADALRDEIEQALLDRWLQDGPSGPYDEQQAMRLLCDWAGVPYDPSAVRDINYPAGKQRALLQWWGTEYRRAQDPDYWVKRTAERISQDSADVAVISDLRFFNEFEYVKANGYAVRIDRPGFEIDDGQHHISEVTLDPMPDEAWSHVLVNDGGAEKLRKDAVAFFDRAVANLLEVNHGTVSLEAR